MEMFSYKEQYGGTVGSLLLHSSMAPGYILNSG